jgi:thioredoxin 1
MKLIKLYQPNCRPCTFVENFLLDAEVEYNSINVQENVDAAVQYGIMSTPVTILLDSEGNEIQRSAGFNPDELEELISKL